jgi:hypothetical protein
MTEWHFVSRPVGHKQFDGVRERAWKMYRPKRGNNTMVEKLHTEKLHNIVLNEYY